jgi:hypothetical protein
VFNGFGGDGIEVSNELFESIRRSLTECLRTWKVVVGEKGDPGRFSERERERSVGGRVR